MLTEGVFDWLTLVRWEFPACAALGTQGVEKVAASLRGCGRVFLAFDADDAGREVAARLQSLLGRVELVMNAVVSPVIEPTLPDPTPETN